MKPVTTPIPLDYATRIYDILVEHAKCHEGGRDDFIYAATRGTTYEYRIGGIFGYGGKFWNVHEKWRVSSYKEDTHKEQQAALDIINPLLADLYKEWSEKHGPGTD